MRLLKLGLLLGCLVTIAYCGFPPEEEIQATVALGNQDLMARACATNYTRKYATYCNRNQSAQLALTVDNVCRTIDLNAVYGAPTTTALSNMHVQFNMVAQNGVANQSASLLFYSDNTCATNVYSFTRTAREFVAVGGGAIYDQHAFAAVVPSGTPGNIYYKAVSNVGVGHHVLLTMVGYYD